MPRPLNERRIAEEFLRARQKTSPLPQRLSTRELARLAGVSYATMWRAAQKLKVDGEWREAPRPETDTAISAGRHSVERIQEELTRDLMAATIVRQSGLLPVKELAERYGTSAYTIRTACANLHDLGLLERAHRHYRKPRTMQHCSSRVIFLARSHEPFGIVVPENDVALIHYCESICRNSHLSFEPLTLRVIDERCTITRSSDGTPAPLPTDETVAGYIYLLNGYDVFFPELVQQLIATGKPVAFIDRAGAFPSDSALYRLARLRVFADASIEEPGRQMARYLLNKGHRHFAFISPFDFEPWSRSRQEGVRQVLALAGNMTSLTLFTARTVKHFEDFVRNGEEATGSREFSRSTSRWINKIAPAYRDEIQNGFLHDLRNRLTAVGVRKAIQPLFAAAAKKKEITAWILPNDHSAMMALAYCRERGINVPAQVAIVGFDDLQGASTMRLTSYNFNIEAAANTAVNFLLKPRSTIWRKNRNEIVQGMVVERESG